MHLGSHVEEGVARTSVTEKAEGMKKEEKHTPNSAVLTGAVLPSLILINAVRSVTTWTWACYCVQ
jgi:hypothetical protein